jgi:hypothetical protein
MGFWNSLKSAAQAVADVVEDVADAVTDAVEEVFDSVTDVVESLGNVIEDATNWVADQARKIPGVGKFLSGMFNWLGRSISSTFDFVAGAVKGVVAIATGIVSGAIKIVGGTLTLNWPSIKKGIIDIGAGVLGGVVLILGRLVDLAQTISYFLQPNERSITEIEKAMLKRIFESSLAVYNIKIVEGYAGLFSVNGRPFVLGNTIYLKDRDVVARPEVLVHECIHVWQYQHFGASYVGNALGAQWFINDYYNWRNEIARGREDWADFNKESQGQFHEDLYPAGELLVDVNGTITPEVGDGVFYDSESRQFPNRFEFDGNDHTERANDSMEAIRSKVSYRLSRLF